MPGDSIGNAERRGNGFGRASPWLAPAFICGALLTGGGFVYSYAVSNADAKRTAEDVTVLRKDFEIRRLEDLKNIGDNIASLRADMMERARSDEDNRRRIDDQLNAMDARIQRFDDQMGFQASIKPGSHR